MSEPFRSLFDDFLEAYLSASGDRELLEVLPPFFAFRALVIAHPDWYPDLDETTRRALLSFAQAMAASGPFEPVRASALLAGDR